MDLGDRSLRTAPLEDITVFSSIGTPGSDFGSEPVARITALAWIVSFPPVPATPPVSRHFGTPRPGTGVILFFLNRNSEPFDIRAATARLPGNAPAEIGGT